MTLPSILAISAGDTVQTRSLASAPSGFTLSASRSTSTPLGTNTRLGRSKDVTGRTTRTGTSAVVPLAGWVTVMTVSPFATPVTVPAASTVAMLSSADE